MFQKYHMQARKKYNVLKWTTQVFLYAKLNISMRAQNSWDVTKSKIYHSLWQIRVYMKEINIKYNAKIF